ncbi:MAG: hypothetical protein ACLTWO_10110 [Blautia massiliensis (ex Durand et al. 2017)]|nr:MAG: hypothetical protein DBX91_15405 [Subdoligranulum variabile]
MTDRGHKMDEQLEKRVADLAAHNDETGDGRLDAADLKAQLNRLEAQLELQDQQNRRIMRNQRLRMMMSIAITILLLVALGAFWYYSHIAYTQVMDATTHVNELAATLQASLDSVDPEALDSMMQDLPEITEQLKRIDVDALNAVLDGLPALMDNVEQMQERLESLGALFGNLGDLFRS